MNLGTHWMARAACRNMPVSMFYPDRGSRYDEPTPDEKRAKRMCAQCPVRVLCLAYALNIESKQLVIGTGEKAGKQADVTIKPQAAGIWGGQTASQRTNVNMRHLEGCKRTGHGACRPLVEQVRLLEELFVARVHEDRILLVNEDVVEAI